MSNKQQDIDPVGRSDPSTVSTGGKRISNESAGAKPKINNIDDISPLKLNSLKKKSDQIKQRKEIDEDYQQALKYEQDLKESGNYSLQMNTATLGLGYELNSPGLQIPVMNNLTNKEKSLGLSAQKSVGRESNPQSLYGKLKEEELKELERKEAEEIEKQLKNEKEVFKLADYFITVGIDDYHTPSEIYGNSKKETNNQSGYLGVEDVGSDNLKITPQTSKSKKSLVDLKFIDDAEEDFDRVISKLEIFVIKDNTIFDKDYTINGAPATVVHPELIDLPNEKWIDLRGDKYIYLKISFDDVKNCRRPISDLNFYKISRFKQQPHKMCIHVKQGIEPIPIKEFADPQADQKYKKTKKIGKTGDGSDDMYNFYGDYDLTPYFEDTTNLDPQVQKKNLCLCISVKKQAPTQDVILVVGQQIDITTGEILDDQSYASSQDNQNMTMNWEVPEGYKKLQYSIGTNGCLNRLLCLKTRDVMKKKMKPKIIDRYPKEDRHYYPCPANISDFCFPSAISLKTEQGLPQFFNFSLTDENGTHIFGTALIFDEDLSQAFKDKLQSLHVKNIEKLRAVKAICILSHYCFNQAFKDILKQLYRMQISNTSLHIPIERYIVNLMEEIPLPDEGKLLIQYELQGQIASFYRPTDQHPPFVGRDEIESLFKCLNVDSILEIFAAILLERKILMVSKHKALLTQVINCFASFIFPFQWKHTLIPILPSNLIDILDAPFPFIIGIEPSLNLEYLDIENEVIRINLDEGQVITPNEILQQSHMPQMPFKEKKILKQRLLKASEHIEQIPDPVMLEQIDLAFNVKLFDPDEDFYIDHLEVRDAFLEFMSTIMSGYTKFIKDPSQRPEEISCSKDFFDLDRFRMQKDSKKPFTFIYKLTETIHFSYFVECRCFGKSDRDNQIMAFDKLINEKRSRMKPRLLFPFHQEKTISSLPPNEEGIEPQEKFNYKIFPKFDVSKMTNPRSIQNYNIDSMKQQIMGSLITNEKLIKMHDSEWARYMLEVLFLLWFQVFCSTLPIYGSHAQSLIDFARRILNYIRGKIKPMRDIEFIYRRLFEACGTTKQITELRELYKEMVKNKIEPDKVTSGVYYQALLQCKRRAGTKEANQDIRKSYFQNRMEDFQEKLNKHQDDENRSQNRTSILSYGMRSGSKGFRQNSLNKGDPILDDENIEGCDFGQLLEPQQVTQQTALDTQNINRISNPMRLSYILENCLFIEITKNCTKCKETLREEEVFSGFLKNLSNYTVKCPICSGIFVPKFTIYSESENQWIDGKKGKVFQLLPPLTLYKDFCNVISNEGESTLMNETFIQNHEIVFWNMILYFKIINLPIFMLDLDYSPFHQKQHCSLIKKFLPFEKNKQNKSSFFNLGSSVRKNSKNKHLPPKLDSNALKKLNEIQQSPNRFGDNSPYEVPQINIKQIHVDNGSEYGENTSQSRQSFGKRPGSIKRAAGQFMNVFSSSKKKDGSNSNRGSKPDYPEDMIGELQSNNNELRKQVSLHKDKDVTNRQSSSGGGVQGIHFSSNKEQNNHPYSQAPENDKKGIQNFMQDGMKNLYYGMKKPSSQKSGGRAGSQRSGGPGSAVTTLSDLEKIEKIMNEAKHADKSIVKYFGKYFEEYRRDQHYYKEIVFSDMFTGYGVGPNDQMAENNINFHPKSQNQQNEELQQ